MNRANFISGLIKKQGWKGKALISEQAASSMTYPASTFGGKVGRYLIRNLYEKVDMVLATSRGIKYEMKHLFNISKPCEVVHNPVNINFIEQKVKDDETINFDRFTFINVGRIEPQKNHDLLIRAFAKLKDKDCQLVLLGDGYLRPEIETLIAEQGVKDKVKIMGFVNNPYKYLTQADCFVLSSHFEGFPNVVLEALSCALPIISTDCPTGPREILMPEKDESYKDKVGFEKTAYGYLVDPGNKELLGNAMIQFYENQNNIQELKENSLKRAEYYDVKKVMKQFFDILSEEG